jgi:hypothetical protein
VWSHPIERELWAASAAHIAVAAGPTGDSTVVRDFPIFPRLLGYGIQYIMDDFIRPEDRMMPEVYNKQVNWPRKYSRDVESYCRCVLARYEACSNVVGKPEWLGAAPALLEVP